VVVGDQYSIKEWSLTALTSERFFDAKSDATNEWDSIKDGIPLGPVTKLGVVVNKTAVFFNDTCVEVGFFDPKLSEWVFQVPIASFREIGIVLEHINDPVVLRGIEAWDERAWDFVQDCIRAYRECATANIPWWPSNPQVLYMARLHRAFVDEDGIGAQIIHDGGVS
jgi:hypothetical protein